MRPEDIRRAQDRKALEHNADMRELQKAKTPKKEQKSPFDNILEEGRRLQEGAVEKQAQSTKQTTEKSIKAIEKFKEKYKEQAKEKEEKKEKQKQEAKEEGRESQYVGKRVTAKGKLKKDSGGSGGKGKGGGESGQGKRFVAQMKEGNVSPSRLQSVGAFDFAKAFQAKLSEAQIPKTLPPEVIQQIIRHIRIGLSERGEKEIELQLHQAIFKGLRLRLSSNHGKVNVHFMTANGGVREFFSREKSAIQAKLEARGITVGEITVT